MHRQIAIALASVLVMCLPLVGIAPPVGSQALEPVSIRMDWLTISYHAPFHHAVARGYYRAAGIDLKIAEGKGSGGTVQLVANGADTFGLADAAVVAKSVTQGVPVKTVMGVFRKSAVAVVFPAQSPIQKPGDLKGKRVATCAGDSAVILFPAFLKANGLSLDDLKIVTVDCAAKYTVVAQGLADATLGFGPYGRTMFRAAGVSDIRKLDYADSGVALPSHAIIASLKTIEAKPDLIRRFVSATTRGWLEARKNPDAAIEAMVRAAPLMKGKEAALKAEFEGYANYLDTPATAGKPFGWQSPEDWKRAEAILAQYMDLKPQPSVDAYFTNSFVQ
jgi:NitT/TauT family transport system substrate-binding protein